MPFLNLKIAGHPAAATIARLGGELTRLAATVLGKHPEVTAVAIETLPPERWFIGGESLAASGGASFFLDIEITAGSNSAEEKAAFVAAAFAALAAALGGVAPASYVVVHELPADAWGYEGRTQAARRQAAPPINAR